METEKKRNKTDIVFLIVAVITIIITVIFVGILNKGIVINKGAEGIQEYESFEELRKHTTFDFQIPPYLMNTNISDFKYYDYTGAIFEANSEKLGITFRFSNSAPVAADISGVVETFAVDKKYEYSSDEKQNTIRYRTDQYLGTLLNYRSSEVSYSLEINAVIPEEDMFKYCGFNITDYKEIDRDTDINIIDNKAPGNSDISYKLYESKDLGISFMIPSNLLDYNIEVIDDTLMLLIDYNMIFEITYYSDGYDINNFSDYGAIALNKNYLLLYNMNNQFDKNTKQYNDYNIAIENINLISETFKVLESEVE